MNLLVHYANCLEILKKRASIRQTISYGELAKMLGLSIPRQQWSTVLDPIREAELKRVGKDLSQIVVYSSGPAKGFPRYFSNSRLNARSELLDPKDPARVAAFKSELDSIYDKYAK